MKLRDLDPKLDGEVARGILEFDCPLGHPHTIQVPIGSMCERAWASSGEFPDSLTLSPSILAHEGHPKDWELRGDAHVAASRCGWHGFVTNGEVTTC